MREFLKYHALIEQKVTPSDVEKVIDNITDSIADNMELGNVEEAHCESIDKQDLEQSKTYLEKLYN